MRIAGVILAGGLSRRMGGQEKSLMQLVGREPIVIVANRLGSQVDQLCINANGDPARFDHLKLPVIADTVDGFVGPLAGVLAGMRWATQIYGVTHIITAAADTPFFPKSYVQRMADRVSASDGLCMAKSVGRVHPVFGLWPINLADALQNFLVVEDKRKILEFANRYRLEIEDFDDIRGDPFFNINTPDDLVIAEQMMRENSQ